MKKQFFKSFFLLFIFCIMLNPVYVLAVGGGTGGGSGSTKSCNSNVNYCYMAEGVRFSLYKYEPTSKNLTTLYTVDYAINGSSLENYLSLSPYVATNTPRGKIQYLHTNEEISFSKHKKLDFVQAPLNYGSYDKCYSTSSCYDFATNLLQGILDKIGIRETAGGLDLKSGVSSDTLVENIKTMFLNSISISTSDLSKLYFTIEPVVLIKKGSNYWYGSSYELRHLLYSKGENMFDVDTYLKKTLPNSIKINKIYGTIDPTFKNKYAIKKASTTDNLTVQQVKAEGFGINLIWFGSLFKTCKDVCGTSPTLTCSSNYCETAEGVSDSRTKKDCIVNQCEYKKTFYQSCSSSCPSQKSTKCSDPNRIISSDTSLNSIKSCKQYYSGENNYLGVTEYYYKAECTENNKVSYSSTLPTTINKFSGGFNYYLKLSGSKTCTYTFNKAKYEFEKAALFGIEKTSTTSIPEKALKKFKTLGNKDNIVDIAKYTNEVTADLNVNGSKYDDLVVDTENSTSKVDKAKLVSDYKATSITSGTTFMSLQPRCYSIRDGSIYKIALGQTCYEDDTLDDYNTFGYFSNSDDDYITNTVLQIKKKNLSTNTYCTLGTDECYFITDDEDNGADCFLTVTDTFGNEADAIGGYYKENIKISYNYNKNNISDVQIVEFCFNGMCNSDPDIYKTTDVSVPTSGVKEETITGAIKYRDSYNKLIVKYCPRTVKLKKDPSGTSDTCSEKYTPTKYAAIDNYCRTYYSTDKKGYSSVEECIKDCSTSRLKCKSRYTPDQFSEIVNYCNTSEGKLEYDGSSEKCINDCSRFTTDGNSKYIYRPISLGVSPGTLTPGAVGVYNAFPNRKAGSNWIGYEEKYTKNDPFDGSAIYVIELDSDSIKRIKNDTKNKGKNVYFYNGDDTVTLGKYESKFIETNTNIFVCINGRGNCNEEGSGW